MDPKWARLLRNNGFQDIEDKNGRLKEFHTTRFANAKKLSTVEREAKERYYQLATQLVFHHKFSSPEEKAVWTLHADGRYDSEIADELGLNKSKVYRIIRNVRKFITVRD